MSTIFRPRFSASANSHSSSCTGIRMAGIRVGIEFALRQPTCRPRDFFSGWSGMERLPLIPGCSKLFGSYCSLECTDDKLKTLHPCHDKSSPKGKIRQYIYLSINK
jgi:hypothetical protein